MTRTSQKEPQPQRPKCQRPGDSSKRLDRLSSDIVIENFKALGSCQKWGLGYEELCRIKPDIVYVVDVRATAIPAGHHHYTTFGPVAQAV